MPISGLVIVFDGNAIQHTDSLNLLRKEPAIEVGDIRGNKTAVVVESQSKTQDQQLSQWIRALPGVVDLQIAFVSVDDAPDGQPSDTLK